MEILVELLFNAYIKYRKRDGLVDDIDKEYDETYQKLWEVLSDEDTKLLRDFECAGLGVVEKEQKDAISFILGLMQQDL